MKDCRYRPLGIVLNEDTYKAKADTWQDVWDWPALALRITLLAILLITLM